MAHTYGITLFDGFEREIFAARGGRVGSDGPAHWISGSPPTAHASASGAGKIPTPRGAAPPNRCSLDRPLAHIHTHVAAPP